MKRKPKVKPDRNLYRHFSIFSWRKCGKCRMEFRRQRAWRILTGRFHGGMGRFRYICGDCAPDVESANSVVASQPWIPPRPSAPPPPPAPKPVAA